MFDPRGARLCRVFWLLFCSRHETRNVHVGLSCPQDYMEDVHGKEISLQYVTVKVPGQKPRGSKTIMSLSSSNSHHHHHHHLHHHHHSSSNGLSEHLSNISISNFQSKDKRTADKVLLTAFELLKEPSYRNGGPA